jgi:uncharacterized protein with FMN-binding domain
MSKWAVPRRRGALGAAVLVGSVGGMMVQAQVAAAPRPTTQAATKVRAHITSIRVLKKPAHGETSKQISRFALPLLKAEAIKSHGAHVHTISGATYTSKAFRRTLHYALTRIADSEASTTVTSHTVTVPYDGAPRGVHAGRLKLRVTGHSLR